LTKGPNDNRLSIAFSVERNSGIDCGDLADPTRLSFLQIGLAFCASKLGKSLRSVDTVEELSDKQRASHRDQVQMGKKLLSGLAKVAAICLAPFTAYGAPCGVT
jgi:hypothetical protein